MNKSICSFRVFFTQIWKQNSDTKHHFSLSRSLSLPLVLNGREENLTRGGGGDFEPPKRQKQKNNMKILCWITLSRNALLWTRFYLCTYFRGMVFQLPGEMMHHIQFRVRKMNLLFCDAIFSLFLQFFFFFLHWHSVVRCSATAFVYILWLYFVDVHLLFLFFISFVVHVGVSGSRNKIYDTIYLLW